jgi:alpha-galactosidase
VASLSAKRALENYLRKSAGLKRETKPKKHKTSNREPEREVQKAVTQWCKEKGFDVSVVESKAVYSRSAGRYLRGQTEAGFSDIVGTDTNGKAIFIELKAAGKLSTLKPHQYDFLLRKIRLGAFAVCVDSAVLLDSIYSRWTNLADHPAHAKRYLEELLPKSKLTREMLDHEFKF